MAVRYIGLLDASAGVQVQAGRAQVVAAALGGTLTGSQVVQLVFDDTKFSNANLGDGKQRLLAALEAIKNTIANARSWPIDASS